MKINKREQKFLINAVSFGWELMPSAKKIWHWDDDVLLPCYPGVVCDELIRKGILEECFRRIRLTDLGKEFKCTVNYCEHGHYVEYDFDTYEELSRSNCINCQGTGVILENK